MPLLILLALIAVPLIELTIFIEIGEDIGALPVVALTIFTAVAGLALVRAQGLDTLRRAQQELERKRAPVAEMLHGALIALSGLLLLIPGFLTDLTGAVFLVPQVRGAMVRALLRRYRPRADQVIIEGEYWEEPDSDRRRPIEGEDDERH